MYAGNSQPATMIQRTSEPLAAVTRFTIEQAARAARAACTFLVVVAGLAALVEQRKHQRSEAAEPYCKQSEAGGFEWRDRSHLSERADGGSRRR